jgi:hypothetical protein
LVPNEQVIHRVLCYQKRTQTRINYQWQGLWAALAGLVKFIMKNMDALDPAEGFMLADQAVNICNFLMYYGDTLLSSLGWSIYLSDFTPFRLPPYFTL